MRVYALYEHRAWALSPYIFVAIYSIGAGIVSYPIIAKVLTNIAGQKWAVIKKAKSEKFPVIYIPIGCAVIMGADE